MTVVKVFGGSSCRFGGFVEAQSVGCCTGSRKEAKAFVQRVDCGMGVKVSFDPRDGALNDLLLTFTHSQTNQSFSILLRRSLVINIEVFLVPDSATNIPQLSW